MSKLSFKNFRGFIDFPELEFGGITFLVGKNNSGKSTAIKALLLIVDYLNSDDASNFSFDSGKLGDYANIKSFSRAKNKYSKDDYVMLSYQIDNHYIEIILTEKDNSFKPTIKSLTIKDIKLDFSIVFNQCNPNDFNLLGWEVSCKQTFINGLSISYAISLYGSLLDCVNNIRGHFESVFNYNSKDVHTEGEKYNYERALNDKRNSYNPENRTDESIKVDMINLNKIIGSLNSFVQIINHINLIYVGASLPKQTAIFRIADKDNALAQAVTEYIQLGIDRLVKQYRNFENEVVRDPIANLVTNWIGKEKFEIGDDLEISIIEGEGYTVKVKNEGEWISIADKGMGAMQLLTIVFRLACTLYKSNYSSNRIQTIIVFEEPELNLHPALQSKLADLFYEVHILSKGKIQIIVETHSEYIIRKMQYLIAKGDCLPESIFIYYFEDQSTEIKRKVRKITIDKTGRMSQDFGTGFFDEADNIAVQIFSLNQHRNN